MPEDQPNEIDGDPNAQAATRQKHDHGGDDSAEIEPVDAQSAQEKAQEQGGGVALGLDGYLRLAAIMTNRRRWKNFTTTSKTTMH